MRHVIGLAVVVVCAVMVRPADACINGVVMEKEEAVKKIARAQKAMDKGKYRRALRLLKADHYFVSGKQMRKISLIKAVARLRLGKTRSAERYFRRRLKKDADNPFLLARLAEALSTRKGDDAIEAWKILDDLEKRDLIPDAHGYAVLARLRKRASDEEGYARAVTACRKMAADVSICPEAPDSESNS